MISRSSSKASGGNRHERRQAPLPPLHAAFPFRTDRGAWT